MKLALKLAAAMLGCGLALPQAGLAQDVPFADEIHVFGIEDEVYPPQGCETLFVGSSSFRFWFAMAQDFPRTRLLKRGFGGSQISDINFHFDRVVGRYRPARIAFYAGVDQHEFITRLLHQRPGKRKEYLGHAFARIGDQIEGHRVARSKRRAERCDLGVGVGAEGVVNDLDGARLLAKLAED
ncbi:MAG: hypothetical protein CVT83_08975, partial [Alphaproteobacteria bacterium HGW-Alphaproteobacteria-5]